MMHGKLTLSVLPCHSSAWTKVVRRAGGEKTSTIWREGDVGRCAQAVARCWNVLKALLPSLLELDDDEREPSVTDRELDVDASATNVNLVGSEGGLACGGGADCLQLLDQCGRRPSSHVKATRVDRWVRALALPEQAASRSRLPEYGLTASSANARAPRVTQAGTPRRPRLELLSILHPVAPLSLYSRDRHGSLARRLLRSHRRVRAELPRQDPQRRNQRQSA